MSIESARAALNLVGKTVRPTPGSERAAFANGKPRCGKVVDIYFPDLNHPYLNVDFGTFRECMYAFELDVVEEAAA
ncbi:MAG: hypothetical protein LBE62_03045 [Azonexus sp.]|jgi:hypothetical protein|nr:hypothetical protein [Azonexus sp.]